MDVSTASSGRRFARQTDAAASEQEPDDRHDFTDEREQCELDRVSGGKHRADTIDQIAQSGDDEEDAQSLPFDDDAFDAVLLHLVLSVVPEPAAVAKETARVLRADGRVSNYETFSCRGLVAASMSVTIQTPDAEETCAYCGSPIFDHDPICVRDCTEDCGSPSFFCNYACLSAYIDENELTYGDACEWSPE